MRHTRIFEKWGCNNMFDALIPSEEDKRQQLFTGRERELRTIVDHLISRDRALLIYGLFGMGKTMLMKEALSNLEPDIITVYTNYVPNIPFKVGVLSAVAQKLASLDNELAKDILHSLRGGTSIREREGKFGLNAKAKLFGAEVGTDGEKSDKKSYEMSEIKNPDIALQELRASINKRIVVAVDDIERRADINLIQGIRDDIRTLRDYKYSIIVSGHPVNATSELHTSSYGVLIPIELTQLSVEDLEKVVYAHLELGRKKNRNDFYPFTKDAVTHLAKKFKETDNTVREFIVACFHMLEQAIDICDDVIETKHIDEIFPNIASQILSAMHDEDYARRVLRLMREHGGIIDEDVDFETLRKIIGSAGGFQDALDKLGSSGLFESTLIVKDNDGTQINIKINQSILTDSILDDIFNNSPE